MTENSSGAGTSAAQDGGTHAQQGFSTAFAEDFLPGGDQDTATRYRAEQGAENLRRARGTDTTEGRMFTITGGDWEALLADTQFEADERIIVNMGPQHPSTHGVLRLILELEGETVVQARSVVGYLHTGIEKSCEYRTWTQGVTFVTRADYLAPAFNETAY